MTEDQKQPENAGQKGERIAKRMARAGLCSRRDAERWIAQGRVSVNGKLLDSPALTVTEADEIVVDDKKLGGREPTRLWRYHKPAGLVTSHRDERGRDTIFDHLPEGLPRVISVGRLDLTSEGLLLLTNDGELARHLELPSTGWTRKYRVRAFGTVTQAQLDELKKGVKVEGVSYGGIEAHIDRPQGDNVWLHMTLREGKNREIRRV
ncbi:MAG: pseudouridine synthase, partial [Alphaproteobacteria bacterium]|nr:pseudouridine synthase [Alphaproteobacteria bacterium]